MKSKAFSSITIAITIIKIKRVTTTFNPNEGLKIQDKIAIDTHLR